MHNVIHYIIQKQKKIYYILVHVQILEFIYYIKIHSSLHSESKQLYVRKLKNIHLNNKLLI